MTIAAIRTVDSPVGWPDVVLSSADGPHEAVVLVTECGRTLYVDAARWHQPAGVADHSVIRRCVGPVLDIGCGPGRMLIALEAQGIASLGVELSEAAADRARSSGAVCVTADVFRRVPSEGGWATALLLDGNVGIGGDPTRLLRRVAELVTPDGAVVIEVEPPHHGRSSARRVQVTHGSTSSAWFAWAVVSIDEIPLYAAETGWSVAETWSCDSRWFVRLARAGVRS